MNPEQWPELLALAGDLALLDNAIGTLRGLQPRELVSETDHTRMLAVLERWRDGLAARVAAGLPEDAGDGEQE